MPKKMIWVEGRVKQEQEVWRQGTQAHACPAVLSCMFRPTLSNNRQIETAERADKPALAETSPVGPLQFVVTWPYPP